MPTAIDLTFAFVLVVVVSIFEYWYFWPHFRADVAAERAGARMRAYQRGVVGQWLFALGAIIIWLAYRRPWSGMYLAAPRGWRLLLGLAVVALSGCLVAAQLWSVLRLSLAQRVAARPKLGRVAFMLPRSRRELAAFLTLALTAGFCEELLYRGYLPWLGSPWLGSVLSMALVVLIFGASHIYQGWSGAIKATVAGGVMAALVLATRSLIPSMIVHALIDIGGGSVGYLLLREGPSAEAEAGADVMQQPRRA